MSSPSLLLTALLALFTPASHASAVPNRCAATVNTEMCALIERGNLVELLRHDFRDMAGQVDDFYRSVNYRFVWTTNGHPTRQAREIIRSFEGADKDGLQPSDYDGPRWALRLLRLVRAAPRLASEFAHFDLALTVSLMRFISDLRCGHPSPQRRLFGADAGCRYWSPGEFVRNRLLNASDIQQVLKEAEPPYEGYRKLKVALEHYLATVQEDETELSAGNQGSINPGDPCPFSLQLARRLQQLGDLPEGKDLPMQSEIYNGRLVDAITHFQLRNGLLPDGIIDADTLKQLNIPMRERILQIRLALEQWRWLPHAPSARFILVNIPEFQLTAFDGQRAALSMKAIVGEALDGSQGQDHRTPILHSSLESLTFFPMWNIPPRIAAAEMLPGILADPGYLTDHQYELVNRQGSVINPGAYGSAILRKILNEEWRIRQKPGPENPLGTVKFVFHNANGIYIHGTSEQELFLSARRDFSHGCIRIEKPIALAEWVLREQAPDMARQMELQAENSQSLTVRLVKRVPIIVVYQTATVEEGGDVYFFNDLYGLDRQLADAVGFRGEPQNRVAYR